MPSGFHAGSSSSDLSWVMRCLCDPSPFMCDLSPFITQMS
jgi:hypothetical protein